MLMNGSIDGLKIIRSNIHFLFLIQIQLGAPFFSAKESTFNAFKFEHVQVAPDHSRNNDSYIQFNIQNCSFGNHLQISNTELNNVCISSSTVNKQLQLANSTFKSLNLEFLRVEKRSIIHNTTIEKVDLEFNEFIEAFQFTPECKISKCYITDCSFSQGFDLSKIELQEIRLNGYARSFGELYFSGVACKNIFVLGVYQSTSHIQFTNCKFKSIYISEFINNGTLSFRGLTSHSAKSSLQIIDSDMGKLRLLNCDLSTFQSVQIESSFLNSTQTLNVVWFDFNRLNNDSKEKYRNNREVFRELKNASQKQGDRIQMLQFKSLELKNFKDEHFLAKSFIKKWGSNDGIILKLGSTNDYGLTWWKPVVWALSLSYLFYLLIITSIEPQLGFTLNPSIESISTTMDIWMSKSGIYWQLLNPVHSLQRMFADTDLNLPNIAFFFDYLLKLELAFFIFQTISAFRKHMKVS